MAILGLHFGPLAGSMFPSHTFRPKLASTRVFSDLQGLKTRVLDPGAVTIEQYGTNVLPLMKIVNSSFVPKSLGGSFVPRVVFPVALSQPISLQGNVADQESKVPPHKDTRTWNIYFSGTFIFPFPPFLIRQRMRYVGRRT